MSTYQQSQREYLAGLQRERLQAWDVVTGASYEMDVDPEYWTQRNHSWVAAPCTVKPDGRVAPCSVKPLTVNECKGLAASSYLQSIRSRFIAAQSAQRETVKPALQALTALLSPPERKPLLSDYPTRLAALEGLYAHYRQAARESASLMQRAPHDGRPPMAVRVASTVGAMEVRAGERWTPSKLAQWSDCRSLHTVPMYRTDRVNARHEWNAAVDRGIVPTLFAAGERKPERAKSSGRVAPVVKRRKLTAADLPRVVVD